MKKLLFGELCRCHVVLLSNPIVTEDTPAQLGSNAFECLTLIGPKDRATYREGFGTDGWTKVRAERDRDCHFDRRDTVLVMRVVKRGEKDNKVFADVERVGSLEGRVLMNFTNPDLKNIATRCFRLG